MWRAVSSAPCVFWSGLESVLAAVSHRARTKPGDAGFHRPVLGRRDLRSKACSRLRYGLHVDFVRSRFFGNADALTFRRWKNCRHWSNACTDAAGKIHKLGSFALQALFGWRRAQFGLPPPTWMINASEMPGATCPGQRPMNEMPEPPSGTVVGKFLEHGFARVSCPKCPEEFLVPYSCRVR